MGGNNSYTDADSDRVVTHWMYFSTFCSLRWFLR